MSLSLLFLSLLWILREDLFKEFAKYRDKWRVEDFYTSPGPIQYDDDGKASFYKTLTLELEQTKRSFF